MKSRLLVALLSLSFLVACGGGSKSSSGGSSSGNVTVTPGTASVPINTTAQFTASVSNSTSGVYWSVNDVLGGNLTTGTISNSGLYTAPAVIPSPATVTIKATSVSDSTQSATAKVTVTSGTALSISLTPSTASVYTGRTQQFTATFNSSTNTGVTWQVNSVTGGDSAHGTISTTSSSGAVTVATYTAPATVPSPATVTITAISQADSTKTATATVTVVPGTVINISPSSVTVPAGGTQTFSATANSQPVNVSWAINCAATQPGACGSISAGPSASATYTAPPFPPPGGSGAVSVTASVSDNSALPAGATLTVQVSNGSLSGQYAYALSGTAGGAPYVSAGTIKFDGAGKITSGAADTNSNGTITQPSITGGTYHVGTDGRGNATLQIGGGTQTWQVVLVDNTKAYLFRTDANATGSGVLYLQDPATFAIGAVTGNYALELAPPAGQTSGAAYAGVLTANGAGVISGGKLDISNGATVSTALGALGTYSAPDATTGRGTMTVTSSGTQNLAYYLVNGSRALAVDLDAGSIVRGELVKQSGSSFSVASFAGNYALVTSGWNTQGKLALGSVFTADGAGALSNAATDINSNGNIQTQAATTGTYAVTDTATGRTEVTVTIGGQSRKFVLYPQAAGVADVLEIDTVQTTSGRMFLRAANADTASAFQGTYSSALAGADFVNPGEMDITGLLTPNGGSAISGSLDVNDAGTIARGVTLQGSYVSTAPAGRKSGSWTTGNGVFSQGQFVYYVVDSKHALVLELDSNRVLAGIMEKPY